MLQPYHVYPSREKVRVRIAPTLPGLHEQEEGKVRVRIATILPGLPE